MNETFVTLQGWLGGDVALRHVGDTSVASFRVACTPRRFSKKSGEWVDGDTQWYTVSAWRALADNCAASLHRGDPVVVHGRLNATTWTSSAGVEMSGFEVDATFVGHDLSRGTATFTKTPRPVAPAEAPPEQAAESPGDSWAAPVTPAAAAPAASAA